ncbi:MAG: hypothetical protein ACE3L7_13740 [Candidatus Pristimantibacillus sp.]
MTNALFRRPAVRIPAVFYGYRGAGVSYKVDKRVEHGLGFRAVDGTGIRFVVEGGREKPNFQHMRGEEWEADEWLYVCLSDDDWLTYEFSLRDSQLLTLEFNLRTTEGSLLVTVNDQMAGYVTSLRATGKRFGCLLRYKGRGHQYCSSVGA